MKTIHSEPKGAKRTKPTMTSASTARSKQEYKPPRAERISLDRTQGGAVPFSRESTTPLIGALS